MNLLAPRNTWYPLTWSRNVTRTLSRHRILGMDLVVYRSEAGGVVALDDACPHRLAPLSMGKLKGDAIECGYHGMTFGANGRCVRIPGQSMIPPNARVSSYPLREKMGLVWIWPGDPALADPSRIYDLPQYGQNDWHAAEGDALRIETNYLNLADNLCDPAHVSFVHLSTLGNSASEDIPVEHTFSEDGVLVWRWIRNAPPIPLFAKYGNFAGNVDRWHYYDYIAPCIAVIDFGSADAGKIVDATDRGKGLRIFACHFITPVDDHICIDHWLHVRNFALDDADVDQRLHADFRIAFNEDKEILERIEEVVQARPNAKTIRLAIDAAPQRMRRIVERMVTADAETRALA
ncbi:aromatic ring-hydroxylating dioxygenase subunit alpha [Bradyrhizobium zhanjiangense]|uniref:Aromatic ring-hydroxylating dioxygenase subunit alpha n=1 Tax=Bradyrhizobium zhanjiangense TaxID=1325107 RepID=A0A4V1KXS6_9BRAD|nr:aromatic ring-hydroxylating dioxygenase subunit alpha [Bradyrhizobium zhanjiangense]RXH03255.1 aromatic ring-hydroxylating dioxygenase subunit alpha [Bradyrhizobium zhanjiangense]